MDRDKVTELLKNYQSYKYAVRMFEESVGIPAPAIAIYDDMPRANGFESRMPTSNDGLTFADRLDYMEYKTIVNAIDGAVDNVLSDDERRVIKRKWLDRNRTTLYALSIELDKDESTIRRWHKEALRKLSIALAPLDVPMIHDVVTA